MIKLAYTVLFAMLLSLMSAAPSFSMDSLEDQRARTLRAQYQEALAILINDERKALKLLKEAASEGFLEAGYMLYTLKMSSREWRKSSPYQGTKNSQTLNKPFLQGHSDDKGALLPSVNLVGSPLVKVVIVGSGNLAIPPHLGIIGSE